MHKKHGMFNIKLDCFLVLPFLLAVQFLCVHVQFNSAMSDKNEKNIKRKR